MVISTACKFSSRMTGDLFIAILLISAFFISAIVPPLESPDEGGHIARAYFLSKGMLILDTPKDQDSGGMIDSGLNAYASIYANNLRPNKSVTPELNSFAKKINWSGEKIFISAAGTGYYFPAVYTPQALGLAIGEKLSLSIDTSYRLARFLASFVSIALLFVAFRIFPPPIIVMGLLIIPMNLFQISSASLDGITNSIAILGISVFARITADKSDAKNWLIWLLSAAVFLVASSRIHLAPMLLLVFGSFIYTKDKKSIFLGFLLTLSIATWIFVAMKTTVDTRVNTGISPSKALVYYATTPSHFARVLWHTLANIDFIKFYSESFIGILGWLDAPFSKSQYSIFYILLSSLLITSIEARKLNNGWSTKAILMASSLGSVFIVFLALLITWTPHPALSIQGVQGRYFFVPSIMLAYAICSNTDNNSNTEYKNILGILTLAAAILYSTYSTTGLLIKRYYLNADVKISRIGNTESGYHFGELLAGQSFEQSFIAKDEKVLGIKIQLATFTKTITGTALLEIIDDNNIGIYRRTIELPLVNDNDWFSMSTENLKLIPGKSYRLRLSSNNATPGNAITWWASPSDSYPDGAAIVNSSKTPHDFAFVIVFSK